MTSLIQPDRSQTLRRAAVRATLAPSIHNTQPWRFVLSADALEIHADRSRQLRVLDPRGRQMTISCGCALFNARASIAAAGYDPAVERLPDPMQPDLLARVLVGEPRRDGCLSALWTKRPNAGTRTAAVSPMNQFRRQMSPPWLRPPTRRARSCFRSNATNIGSRPRGCRSWPTRSKTPIRPTGPSCAPGPPTTYGAATVYPRRRSRTLMRDPGTRYRSGTSTREEWAGCRPRRSPRCANACYCWGPAADDPVAWLRSGEALERVLLELTRRGYVASPFTQVIEVARTNALLRQELALTMYPHILLRVGRAPATTPTRRRRLVDMIAESA